MRTAPYETGTWESGCEPGARKPWLEHAESKTPLRPRAHRPTTSPRAASAAAPGQIYLVSPDRETAPNRGYSFPLLVD